MDLVDAPEGRCGFVLQPGDIEHGDSFEDLYEWYKEIRAVSCWRETWNNTGQCIWHANSRGEQTEKLQQVRREMPERLDGIKLSQSNIGDDISFSGCTLVGASFFNANLAGVDFSGATLNHVNFGMANLEDANFMRAKINDSDLSGAELPCACLRKTNIRNGELASANCKEVIFRGSEIKNVDLSGTDFNGSDFMETDLIDVGFWQAKLTDTNLMAANIDDVDFTEADIRDAELLRAEISDANLERVDARNADFRRSKLSNSTLKNADFEKADFRRTTLKGVDFENSFLVHTDFREATFENAYLYQTYFSDIRINSDTEFGNTSMYKDPGELDDDWEEKWNATPTEATVWTYRRLQDLHEEYALTERARHYHIKKKEAQKRRHREEGNYPQYAIHAINGVASKHGESPWRVVSISGVVIAIWSILYLLLGKIRVPKDFSGTETVGLGLASKIPVPKPFGGTLISGLDQIATSFYFSVVTFTTLGYGDLQPATGFAQALATVESFIGALLMAYLVFVLGRRTNW